MIIKNICMPVRIEKKRTRFPLIFAAGFAPVALQADSFDNSQHFADSFSSGNRSSGS